MHRLGSAKGWSRSAVTGARIRASAPCMRPRCSEHTTAWVILRHLTERAVPQPELVLRSLGRGLRGEPDLLQGGGQPLDGLLSIQPPVRDCVAFDLHHSHIRPGRERKPATSAPAAPLTC